MKLLIEPSTKKELYSDYVDGIILPLKNYAVESIISFSVSEIKTIVEKSNCEIFIKINKNLLNEDLSTNNSELLNESNMTDEQCFKYLLRQDKGFMTMEEFERLGTKAIQELFPQ